MRYLTTPLFALTFALLIPAGHTPSASAQAPRAVVPTVKVTDPGQSPQDLLRWNPNAARGVTIQVTTRTGRLPSADGTNDPNLLEKMYTLQGRFLRDQPITTAIWRIVDASARIPLPEDTAPESESGLAADDAAAGAAVDTNQPGSSEDQTGSRTASDENDPLNSAYNRARLRLRSAKLSLQKISGGSLRQKLTPNGLVPSDMIATMEKFSARANSAALSLAYTLGLGEITLPDSPIGVGATWKTSIRSELSNNPIQNDVTWTLKSIEGSVIRVGMTCKTRVLTPGNSPRNNTLRNRINKNIRGEITVDLDDPLAIRGRLVQQIASVENLPLEQQKRAEVTWINFTPLVGKPAPQDLRKQNPSGK